MKKMDKLSNKAKSYYRNNKKYILFLITISIIGIVAGSIFTCYLSNSDQVTVKNYIDTFMNNIKNNNLNYIDCFKNNLISNITFITIIWILGMSIIGIPINVISYFTKSFVMGFSLSAFVLKYKSLGILYSLCYIFPHHIINFILYTILMIYSLKFSGVLLYSILNKTEINFKLIINKYFKVLIISIIGIIITSLIETYFVPFLFSKLFLFIK